MHFQVDISISRTGKVHFGDTVLLENPAPADKCRVNCALAVNHSDDVGECSASLTSNTCASARTALVVTRSEFLIFLCLVQCRSIFILHTQVLYIALVYINN